MFLAQKIFLPRTKEESQGLFSSVSSLVPNPRVAEVVGAVALRTVEGSSACKAPGKRKGEIVLLVLCQNDKESPSMPFLFYFFVSPLMLLGKSVGLNKMF